MEIKPFVSTYNIQVQYLLVDDELVLAERQQIVSTIKQLGFIP